MSDDRFRAVLEDMLILGVAVVNPSPPVPPTGSTGPTGPTGPSGPTGPTGATGAITSISPNPNDVNLATDYTVVGTGLGTAAVVRARPAGTSNSWGSSRIPSGVSDTGFVFTSSYGLSVDLLVLDAAGNTIVEQPSAIEILATQMDSITPNQVVQNVLTDFTIAGRSLAQVATIEVEGNGSYGATARTPQSITFSATLSLLPTEATSVLDVVGLSYQGTEIARMTDAITVTSTTREGEEHTPRPLKWIKDHLPGGE